MHPILEIALTTLLNGIQDSRMGFDIRLETLTLLR